MAVDEHNRYWTDPEARSQFFDIDPVTGRHRRFFDIDELAGVRQEDPSVFERTHELVLSLVRDGLVDGLRIDHPDGLADPAGYLARLRERRRRAGVGREDPRPRRAAARLAGERDGRLRVLGRRLRAVRRPRRGGAADARCGSGSRASAAASRRSRSSASSSRRAGRSRPRSSGSAGRSATGSAPTSSPAPCRRCPSTAPMWRRRTASSLRRIARARARRMRSELRRVLLLKDPAPAEFVTRFQQTTPAMMAKGVEDTAFYRYGRLLALNDVGGDPSRFGIPVASFHGELPRARPALPAQPAHDPDPRRQALGRRADADRRAVVGRLRVGRARRALVRAHRGAPRRRRPRRRRALFHLPDAGRGVADRGAADRGVHGEGAARGQAQHELGRPEHGVGGGGQALLPGALLPPRIPRRLRAVHGPRRARSASAPRSASSC